MYRIKKILLILKIRIKQRVLTQKETLTLKITLIIIGAFFIQLAHYIVMNSKKFETTRMRLQSVNNMQIGRRPDIQTK